MLSIRELHRSFGQIKALDGVNLEINPGEFFALLGPSGCGKTTLLRILAGLDQPDGGEILLGGQNLLSISAHERPVNTVFQSYALFPHLSVRENIAFGLRMKKRAETEIAGRIGSMLKLVDAEPLANRKPTELSGGQRQRVALARALINEPRVLLLDEPLAAVDQKLRKQLQSDLKNLQRQLGITFIYVTHDQEEALSLSDRLAVMNHGRIEQLGAPREVYDNPSNRFVAEFLGDCNLVEAAGNKTSFGEITGLDANGPTILFFRPENIRIADDGFAAEVVEVTFTGPELQIRATCGAEILKISTRQQVQTGQRIHLQIPARAVRILNSGISGRNPG